MKKQLISLFTAAVLLTGCRDFIALNLEEKTVNVLAPADNASTTSATVSFFWEALDGARQYHLQVVKPAFDNITAMVADTHVTGTSFSVVLNPGHYQWRIRAENGSTQTLYTVRSLTIDSTSDLSSQTIVLRNPENNYATSATSLTFSCYGLYNATHYRWAFKTHAAGFTGSLVLPEILENDTAITVSGLTEGYYDWGMRGETAFSSTLYTVRSIYIDMTAPAAPVLLSPADGFTSSGPGFSLSWSNGTDAGSPVYDSVYIYSNATLTSLKRSYKISSGSTVSDTLANGTYYWRVKAIDRAGNAGSFSATRWFKLM